MSEEAAGYNRQTAEGAMRRGNLLLLAASLSLALFGLRSVEAQTPGEINAVVHGYVAAWNEGDLDAVTEFVDPGFVRHYAGHLPAEGREALKQLIREFRTAFPDFSVRIKDIVLTDDKVVVSWEASGTNEGPLLEYPPTGREAQWSGISIVRIGDGQLHEEWVVSDRLEMYRQLGFALVVND